MHTRLQWLLPLAILLALGSALAGCNTMRGLGQDVERGGERVQDAATNTQKKM
jgi:predicted small secreted protein